MNIKQIRLVNFKNIKDSTITFKDNLSGIYGPNGTGKTAIIESLQLFKTYFSPRDPEVTINGNYFDLLKATISKYMHINENRMLIEVIFCRNDKEHKLSVEFRKHNSGEIFAYRELYSIKNIAPRARFLEIAEYIFQPNIIGYTFKAKKKNMNIIKNMSEEGAEHYNRIMKNVRFLTSFLMQASIFPEFEVKESSSLDFQNLLSETEILILGIVCSTLKTQCSFKNKIELSLKCISEDKEIYTLIHSYRKLQTEKNLKLLESSIEEIKNIISIIIPFSQLILEKELSGKNEDGESLFYVDIFLIKNNKKINLLEESTGTIKLISLISFVVLYLKYETITIFIDEIDIHVFEYLLANLLEIIAPHAKGQLVFTGHNLLPMERLSKNSIIIATKSKNDVVYEFMKGVSASTNIRQKYLKSQAFWSEDNIEPLMLNVPALEVFVKKLVL